MAEVITSHITPGDAVCQNILQQNHKLLCQTRPSAPPSHAKDPQKL